MAAPPTLQRLTVGDAVAAYSESYQRAVVLGSLSPTTAANYTRDLAEFVELAGAGTVLDDLSADDLDRIMVAYASKPDGRFKRTTKTRSPGATSRFRQSVSRLFTHATRNGWVQMNPVPDMQVKFRASRTRNASRTALPQSAGAALLETATEHHGRPDQDMSTRDTFILHVLVEVGPRVSELCAADLSDVTSDDDGNTWLHIRRGKGGKTRTVPLSPTTRQAFLAWLDQRPEPRPRMRGDELVAPVEDAQNALLLTWRGVRMRPRDVQLMVHRMVKRMPPEHRREVTPHGLRHTAATLLLVSGAADVATVRDILGHTSVATTSAYLDTAAAHMVAAVRHHPLTRSG